MWQRWQHDWSWVTPFWVKAVWVVWPRLRLTSTCQVSRTHFDSHWVTINSIMWHTTTRTTTFFTPLCLFTHSVMDLSLCPSLSLSLIWPCMYNENPTHSFSETESSEGDRGAFGGRSPRFRETRRLSNTVHLLWSCWRWWCVQPVPSNKSFHYVSISKRASSLLVHLGKLCSSLVTQRML